MTNRHIHPPGHESGRCNHRGQNAVRVGEFVVHPGGVQYFQPGDFTGEVVLVPLTKDEPRGLRDFDGEMIPMFLPDFGGVSADWESKINGVIIPRLRILKSHERMVPFCYASRGRTGTFLASLVSVLEPDVEDPIAAIRERHCHHAVETRAQAEAIFALRGKALPEKYITGPSAFTR